MRGCGRKRSSPTSNLFSLTHDWHAEYDAGMWAFVPTLDTLKKMVVAGKMGTFRRPFKGYDPQGTIDYVLVLLPTFKSDTFIRFHPPRRSFDTYYAHNNFAGFPVLPFSRAPYFAIVNALPKLEAHFSALTSKQRILYFVMRFIADEWGVTSNTLHHGAPKRQKGDDADMGDPSGCPAKQKKSCHGTNSDGKGKPESKLSQVEHPTSKRENGNQDLLSPLAQESRPNPPRSEKDLFHDDANISAWIDTVHTARPLSRVPKDVIKSDGEQACPPFEGDWHDWAGHSYVQPADFSLFCSINWVSYLYNCMLTVQPGCWDSPAGWKESNDEDEHESNRSVGSKHDDHDGATGTSDS